MRGNNKEVYPRSASRLLAQVLDFKPLAGPISSHKTMCWSSRTGSHFSAVASSLWKGFRAKLLSPRSLLGLRNPCSMHRILESGIDPGKLRRAEECGEPFR